MLKVLVYLFEGKTFNKCSLIILLKDILIKFRSSFFLIFKGNEFLLGLVNGLCCLFLESLFLVSRVSPFTPLVILSEFHLWGFWFFLRDYCLLLFWYLALKFEQIEFLLGNSLLFSELCHTFFQINLWKCFVDVMIYSFWIQQVVLMIINNHLRAFKLIKDITVHSS